MHGGDRSTVWHPELHSNKTIFRPKECNFGPNSKFFSTEMPKITVSLYASEVVVEWGRAGFWGAGAGAQFMTGRGYYMHKLCYRLTAESASFEDISASI